MGEYYSDIPDNWNEVAMYVKCEDTDFIDIVIESKKIVIYDTCSFRFHSNCGSQAQDKLIEYFKAEKVVFILLRSILMELASIERAINREYVSFLKKISQSGLTVLVLYEESLFDILNECFSSQKRAFEYLSWAVRALKQPVSTITNTLKSDKRLYSQVLEGKYRDGVNVYREFFSAVRENKASGDNLGEEIIAICTNILSQLPGTRDGKYCVITDDKKGAAAIATLFHRTNHYFAGARIIIYSTPRLLQTMYNIGILKEKEDVLQMLSYHGDSKITIYGTTEYDIDTGEYLSFDIEQFADEIMKPNGVNILF